MPRLTAAGVGSLPVTGKRDRPWTAMDPRQIPADLKEPAMDAGFLPDGYERSEQRRATFLADWQAGMPDFKATIDRYVLALLTGDTVLVRRDYLEYVLARVAVELNGFPDPLLTEALERLNQAVCPDGGEPVKPPRPSASDRRTRAAEAVCPCPCGHDDGGSCLTCAWVHPKAQGRHG